jgi:hypothetical protein
MNAIKTAVAAITAMRALRDRIAVFNCIAFPSGGCFAGFG